ncbi:hypothetical protein Kpol_1028p34 [Vanderwaltozyma polyspora DSM 70294]|uniref:PI31 proteasome regulator C-terminal domain-containing protein n=1 Tax=Vanderwaltozyma polyspora (strain ATCC 22028 / DSM 70294 / BCRC 21397 / CBS 2163 / NBRC 10782 / NRRL Y-8283 / UCD 57-17) TaxID=436907 RepID=A7TG04_VANPO|nr:uncharacterized protein Kpol_1028p34 [Vanderwaltozyma polyspora DSM 70294]EDO18761.1 hypothetical protein Kpol_1028p34 [Vanderwaltozyma polyspora DSM 70294]
MIMEVSSSLGFSVAAVVDYLQELYPCAVETGWDEQKNCVKSILKVKDEEIKDETTGEIKEYRVLVSGIEIRDGINCSIFIFLEDELIAQSIFEYKSDFDLTDSTRYPLKFNEFKKNGAALVVIRESLVNKLHLKTTLKKKLQETICELSDTERDNDSLKNKGLENRLNTGSSVPTTSSGFNRPDDMPKFEDEYEVNQPSSTSRFPGLNLGPNHPQGYGDPDLFPMGQRNIDLNNPLMIPPHGQPGNTTGQGGMIFDPSRLNPDDSTRNRGPGYIPGSKYDDPFGKPSGFGNNPNGFGGGPSGFGGGGFI